MLTVAIKTRYVFQVIFWTMVGVTMTMVKTW